ncbi:MAG: M28 family metallopeptidase [Defluviitaleaceae bacterium]|nr:M28 family metallopeptidase [Defluviitaleaceae bacterium]
MKKLLVIIACGLALLLVACAEDNLYEIYPEAKPEIDIEEPFRLTYPSHGYIALGYIEFINDNLYSRIPFSYREYETALWIVDELLAMGYAPEDIEMQEFYRGDVERLIFNQHLMRNAEMRDYSQNIILTVPGQSERTIIVGAHYDGVHNPGASDNASGMSLLLESAKGMLMHDNYHTIIYVFFGAEEVALVGSYVFRDSITQQQRDNVVMMINADVLIEGPYVIFGAGSNNQNSDIAYDVIGRVDAIAREVSFAHDIEIINYPGAVQMMSDHTLFHMHGYTVVNLVGLARTEQGRFHARIWHTPQDCIHHINETWPGKADTNMHAFSIFLEEMLLERYPRGR